MKTLTLKVILLCLGFCLSSCSPQSNHSSSIQTPQDFTVQPEPLTADNFWNHFVGTWSDPNFQGYLKFSLALDEKGQFTSLIWHPNSFKYHAQHLVTLPEYKGLSGAQMDAITLSNEGRRLLLGTLLIGKTQDVMEPKIIDIQLMSKDPLQAKLVAEVFGILRKNWLAPNVRTDYFPVAEQLKFVDQELSAFQSLGIHLTETSSSATRICYNAGWGVGHVRIVRQGELDALLAEGAITADDILVMDELPRELPVVAGIVVSQTSSPSSHPALLAGMLGIPFVYEKQATTLSHWQELADKRDPVFFQASGDATASCQFILRSGASLSPAEAAELSTLKKPLPLLLPDYDRSAKTPLNLNVLSRADAHRVGAKAANVAELRRLIPEHTVAEGLALPVGLFAEALTTATTADGRNLRAALEAEWAVLLAPAVSSKQTAEGLARVRALIEGAKLSAAVQTTILDAVQAVFPIGTRIKLRSSSNIEDHPEFNGAGLYESKGACVGDDANKDKIGLCQEKKDTVIKNVQKVWASLYSLKAWVARRYYGVNESHSGMGILVQRSFKGELANGVAISSYEMNFDGTTSIAVQSTGFPGEDLEVANPPAGKIPETTLIKADQIENQIASTEVPRGRLLMAEELYRELHTQISIIHQHYAKALNPKDLSQFKLDLEWKLVEEQGQKKIIVKQVRPVPMPMSSTQGLDRGTMVVGERKAQLCTDTMEFSDGLNKLTLSSPIQLSMGLHEIPLTDADEIKNPLENLTVAGKAIALSDKAQVAFDEWQGVWNTNNQSRNYTVSVDVPVAGKVYQLQWKGRQERALAQPRLLLKHAQSIWAAELQLFATQEDRQKYQIVLGHQCEGDAYQGAQPGSYSATTTNGESHQTPRVITESFKAPEGPALAIAFQGRTSFGGWDKTLFMHIDRTTISGILDRELVITAPLKSVYAPGHHNFEFDYAFDLTAAEGLTDSERAQLEARGIQRILLRTLQDSFGTQFPLCAVIAVDAFGQTKEIGRVQQVPEVQP